MRVALTHPYSWPEVRRGAERIVHETSHALARRGHEVTILTAGSVPGRTVDDDGVTTIKLKQRMPTGDRHERLFAYQIFPLLVQGRYQAVHSMMARDAASSVRAKRFTGHRTVYEELGNPFRWWWNGVPDGAVRRRLVRTVDVYGCMSNYTLNVLHDEWGRKGSLIPGGVRLSQFLPAQKRSVDPTILFSGAIDEPRKGLADLLGAAEILLDEHPDLRLLLSGPGRPEALLDLAPSRVQERVERLPLGDTSGQGPRYASAWTTALPSIGDSFGMVLIESLASGTPIVVADDAAPPQLVTEATGAVAAPHDPADLARAIRHAFGLARRPETVGACRSFAAQFDWDDALVPILEDLYSGGT